MAFPIKTARYAGHVEGLRSEVEEALRGLALPAEPAGLYEPARYILSGQGKRLRPLLLLLAAETFGASSQHALPAALAVEVCHNFTLVHDDIMDHSVERRGRPTVHVRWDVDTAILCGDYLLTLAYDLLSHVEVAALQPLFRVFSETVVRLCEGQILDKAFEARSDVTVDDYLHMIDCKTGAMLQGTLELGGIVGGAEHEHRRLLRQIGAEIGRAFQIQDDLLDLVAEDGRWGKPIGGDLMEGKKTFLLLETLERAEGETYAWFARILEGGGLAASEIEEARVRMTRLGVLDDAHAAVLRHTETALEHMAALPAHAAVDTLRWLVRRMQARVH